MQSILRAGSQRLRCSRLRLPRKEVAQTVRVLCESSGPAPGEGDVRRVESVHLLLCRLLVVQPLGPRVARVYASGSPRVTDAAGAAAFDSLPLIRIVNEGDPVPLLPPRTLISPADPYVHIGDAVVLLDGPYYCVLGEESKSEPLAVDFWRSLKTNTLRGDVKEHFIASYIERIRPKAAGAVEVPAADRARYIGVQPGGR